jgi:hypothetical protein
MCMGTMESFFNFHAISFLADGGWDGNEKDRKRLIQPLNLWYQKVISVKVQCDSEIIECHLQVSTPDMQSHG